MVNAYIIFVYTYCSVSRAPSKSTIHRDPGSSRALLSTFFSIIKQLLCLHLSSSSFFFFFLLCSSGVALLLSSFSSSSSSPFCFLSSFKKIIALEPEVSLEPTLINAHFINPHHTSCRGYPHERLFFSSNDMLFIRNIKLPSHPHFGIISFRPHPSGPHKCCLGSRSRGIKIITSIVTLIRVLSQPLRAPSNLQVTSSSNAPA